MVIKIWSPSLCVPSLHSSILQNMQFSKAILTINSFDSEMFWEAYHPPCHWLWDPPPRAPNVGEHSVFELFWEYQPFSASTGQALAVSRLSHSASSLDATQQPWKQPKPQECQGDYWPMSNLLWSRGPLSSGDRFTFLTALIELSKSALPAEGRLHSHQASRIIKKPHVFKIKLFLTVSLKYLLFWHTFWFFRFCQAVMTSTLFFETLSFSSLPLFIY